MADKRKVEIFSAGCSVCQDVVSVVERLACYSCDVSVLDMNDQDVAGRARRLGVRSLPAVAVNGKLADRCTGSGIDEATLQKAGIGLPI